MFGRSSRLTRDLTCLSGGAVASDRGRSIPLTSRLTRDVTADLTCPSAAVTAPGWGSMGGAAAAAGGSAGSPLGPALMFFECRVMVDVGNYRAGVAEAALQSCHRRRALEPIGNWRRIECGS